MSKTYHAHALMVALVMDPEASKYSETNYNKVIPKCSNLV